MCDSANVHALQRPHRVAARGYTNNTYCTSIPIMLAFVTLCCAAFVSSVSAAPTWPYSCSAGENITTVKYDLTGQTWLITGADGRLGYQVTLAALKNGATVIATSIDEPSATANCARLASDVTHPNVKCMGMDLSTFSTVKSAVASVQADHKVIDVVIHIAATMGRLNVTADGIVETMSVNLISPALITKMLQPQLAASKHPRVVFIGSANAYDPLYWPAGDMVTSAVKITKGEMPHPGPSTFFFYEFSKFLITQYAAELAKQMTSITSFSVNPGFFRDDPDKYRDQCKPQLLFTPCPQWPDQGATSTFFTAGQPGIEAFSGALIDFDTKMGANGSAVPWTQSGDTCIPRALPPPWTDADREGWYQAVQAMIA
eukprot:m.172171 g.172171  ORF g.172171 m.172171 type:complete len:373 (+) comp13484_c0_seq1:46-1164(+)